MRIEVDRDRCEGVGMCEAMASDFFQVDDDEELRLLDDSPAESERSRIFAAVNSCPVLALTLVG